MELSYKEMEVLDQEQLRARLLYIALNKLSTKADETSCLTPYDVLKEAIDEAYECGYVHGTSDKPNYFIGSNSYA